MIPLITLLRLLVLVLACRSTKVEIVAMPDHDVWITASWRDPKDLAAPAAHPLPVVEAVEPLMHDHRRRLLHADGAT